MENKKQQELNGKVGQLKVGGGVRALANKLMAVLTEAEVGENPNRLAWEISKKAYEKYKGKPTAEDVVATLADFKEQLSVAPKFSLEYFSKQGKKGANSLSHEERVSYGKKGANTLTKEERSKFGRQGAKARKAAAATKTAATATTTA